MADLKIKTGVRQYQNNAVDLGKWSPPVIRSRTADGDIVLERIPSAGHCKMVNPGGHVVRVQLFNGMGKPSGGDPYYLQISREKLQKGFVPYGQCPKVHGLQDSIPKAARKGEACKLDSDGAPVDDLHPCKCVVATIAHRMARTVKQTMETEKRYQSKENRQVSELSSAVSTLAALAAKPDEAPTVAKSSKGSKSE